MALVKRLYSDPFMEEPDGIGMEITVKMNVAFSDEDASFLFDGSLIDPKDEENEFHMYLFNLIKARNILAEAYPNKVARINSIKIDADSLRECAKVLNLVDEDFLSETELFDVEVRF